MSLRSVFRVAIAAGAFLLPAFSARAQETPATPAVTPSVTVPPAEPAAPVSAPGSPAATAPLSVPTPGPAGPMPLRLSDKPALRVDRLPQDNPFGLAAEAPAVVPVKPAFADQVVETSLYAAVHVDKTGKVVAAQWPRNPIPLLAAEEKKSFDRWTFDPARRGGQPVDTWSSLRVELTVNVRAPKIEQLALSPVLPTAPVPAPFDWGTDQAWYDGVRGTLPADGSVSVEEAETLAVPKKTRWDADSFKGPFALRMWVKISAAGRVERSVPIQASDPVLISYFRKQMATWQFRPATVKGQPVDSWSELSVAGQISYSAEIKQIANLRKTLTDAAVLRPNP